MLDTIFATKRGMSQVWTNTGKRKPVTKCYVDDNIVIGKQECIAVNRKSTDLKKQPCLIFEIGYGKKKLKNTPKPLTEKIKKSGFSFGVKQVRGIKIFETDQDENQAEPEIGSSLNLSDIFEVGDVVKVTGVTKGKGFSGVVKKFKFKGGPRTHGQRDRERAPGSIGAMTDPGRVWKGKKMPGRLGGEKRTVKNLVVLHIDQDENEIWLSGPIPGYHSSTVRIVRTGEKKEVVLDKKASGIEDKEVKQEEKKETKSAEKETEKEEAKAEKEKPDKAEAKSEKKEEKKKAEKEEAEEETKDKEKKSEEKKTKEEENEDKE